MADREICDSLHGGENALLLVWMVRTHAGEDVAAVGAAAAPLSTQPQGRAPARFVA